MEENKRKEYIKTIIIIFLLIIIILMVIGLNKIIPTGNVDIFEINIDKKSSSIIDDISSDLSDKPSSSVIDNISSDLNDKPSSSVIDDISSTSSDKTSKKPISDKPSSVDQTSSIIDVVSSTIHEESSSIDNISSTIFDKYSMIPGLNTYDKDIHWSTTNELRIFTNPTYELSNKIAPGYKNAYTFMVRNGNNFDVLYNINFIETNTSKIDMVYRLKDNSNNYIIGSKDDWVKYEKLNLNNIALKKNSADTYILEWLWRESSSDLEIGLNPVGTYRLSIEISGHEI